MVKLTHTQRIENWLGKECLGQVVNGSTGIKHPIPIANAPGALFAYDGEIYGTILGGAGFSSLSDLISEATTGGKRQDAMFYKVGTLAVSAAWSSLWNVGTMPSAGGAPAARPGGSVPTNLTTGSVRQTDPSGGDTLHLTTAFVQSSAAPNTLLLYDRIFHASLIAHASGTASQSVTGVPTRYTGTASKGNFAFLEVTTILGATAQNLTITYTDQDGNSGAASALAMIASSAVTRIPHVPFCIPLSAGDTGIQKVTNVTFSAANTGVSNLVMGHPLAFLPCPIANSMQIMDGINSAFNLVEILSGACLSFLEIKGVATATTYTGQSILVSG